MTPKIDTSKRISEVIVLLDMIKKTTKGSEDFIATPIWSVADIAIDILDTLDLELQGIEVEA